MKISMFQLALVTVIARHVPSIFPYLQTALFSATTADDYESDNGVDDDMHQYYSNDDWMPQPHKNDNNNAGWSTMDQHHHHHQQHEDIVEQQRQQQQKQQEQLQHQEHLDHLDFTHHEIPHNAFTNNLFQKLAMYLEDGPSPTSSSSPVAASDDNTSSNSNSNTNSNDMSSTTFSASPSDPQGSPVGDKFYQVLFEAADYNEDLTISRKEFVYILDKVGFHGVSSTAMNNMFLMIDTNKDGKIDVFEWLTRISRILPAEITLTTTH